jgi:hypothetical protein
MLPTTLELPLSALDPFGSTITAWIYVLFSKCMSPTNTLILYTCTPFNVVL